METIKFKLLHPDAKLPSRGTEQAAAYDVVAVSIRATDQFIEYGLGFATEIPVGWQGKIYPRSSISKYDLALCNSVAIIDSDYRGEWLVRFRRTTVDRLVPIGPSMPGASRLMQRQLGHGLDRYVELDKIAQIQFQRVPEVHFEVVEELSDSTRATGGFGSTGA